MQGSEYTSEHIKKVLTFKGHEILNININYPRFNLKSAKKLNKFYSVLAKSFINFCEKKLYRKAAENFLQSAQEDGSAHEIFTVEMNFKINNEHENIRIYLEININGEKTRRVHIWNPKSSDLIKPAEVKKKFFRFLTT